MAKTHLNTYMMSPYYGPWCNVENNLAFGMKFFKFDMVVEDR